MRARTTAHRIEHDPADALAPRRSLASLPCALLLLLLLGATCALPLGGGRLRSSSRTAAAPIALRAHGDCFDELDRLAAEHAAKPPASGPGEAAIVSTLQAACLCHAHAAAAAAAATGGVPVPRPRATFTLPLLWWAAARSASFVEWASDVRPARGGPYRRLAPGWGADWERPLATLPGFQARSGALAWAWGGLVVPAWHVAGRLAVELDASEGCRVALQPLDVEAGAPAALAAASARVWHHQYGIRALVPVELLDRQRANASSVARGSPFWREVLRRAAVAAGGRAAPPAEGGGRAAAGARGLLAVRVSAAALDSAYRSLGTDVATRDEALTRLVLHSPLSPLSVTRFYHPQLLSQTGLQRQFANTFFGSNASSAASTDAASTAGDEGTHLNGTDPRLARRWMHVAGLSYNVTMHIVVLANIHFVKDFSRPGYVRLDTEEEGSTVGGHPRDSAAQRLEGVSLRQCKQQPSPGAAVALTPSPTSFALAAVARLAAADDRLPAPRARPALEPRPAAGVAAESARDAAEAALVRAAARAGQRSGRRPAPTPQPPWLDGYAPAWHTWSANLYHLMSDTLTRALFLRPLVEMSAAGTGTIAADEHTRAALLALRMTTRVSDDWRGATRAHTPAGVSPDVPFVHARALLHADTPGCQFADATSLLLLREELLRALGLEPPELGYLTQAWSESAPAGVDFHAPVPPPPARSEAEPPLAQQLGDEAGQGGAAGGAEDAGAAGGEEGAKEEEEAEQAEEAAAGPAPSQEPPAAAAARRLCRGRACDDAGARAAPRGPAGLQGLPAPEYVARYGRPARLSRVPRLLLVRRRSSRAWANHRDLAASLASTGVALLTLDDTRLPALPVGLRAFASADLVLAAHGAGLTNILVARPGTVVLEVAPRGFPGLHYARYAHVLGHLYHRWEVAGDKRSAIVAPTSAIVAEVCAHLARHYNASSAS